MSRFVNESPRMYMHWNPTTAMCYAVKMQCSICRNNDICTKIELKDSYGMRMVKSAVLKTFANIGTQGLDKFLKEPIDKTNRSGLLKDYKILC